MPRKLDRIRELGRHLTITAHAHGQLQQLDHLVTLTHQLQDQVEGLERQAARCRTLGLPLDAGGRRKLSDRLSSLRVQLTQDPGQVGQGNTFSGFKEALGDMNRKLRQQADSEWDGRRRAALEATSSSMLSLWETIPELQEDARAVRKHLTSIEGRERPVQDPDQLKSFLKACDEIRVRADRLNAFETPPEVGSFLKAARSSAGAPLGSLSENVRVWLDDHGLLKDLRLTLG